MKRPFVTIILAGGKGTRMGSSDKHKVCFEVLGVPVIIGALKTYNLCGSMLNVVVVGMLAEKVMNLVNQRFPGTLYAYQERPRGTGDAARKGAEILERMRFEGDVLVVAGDKVIEPSVIRRLLSLHEQTNADVTLVTAKRPRDSNTGILLESPSGNIAGILEESERQRLLALAVLAESFRAKSRLSYGQIARTLADRFGEKATTQVLNELGRKGESSGTVSRGDFERLVPEEARQGFVRVGGLAIPADQVLDRFEQMNLSTYLFRAPVLYDALSRLKSTRPTQEEYLTDVFEILAHRQQSARVVGCPIQDLRQVMAFNNPEELLAIEKVYRQKEGRIAPEISPCAGTSLAPAQAWAALLRNPPRPRR